MMPDDFHRFELDGGVLYLPKEWPRLTVADAEDPTAHGSAAAPVIRLPPLPFALLKRTSKNGYLLALYSGGKADIVRADSLKSAAKRIAEFFHENPLPHP